MFQQKYVVGRFTPYLGQRALVDGAKSQYLSRNKTRLLLYVKNVPTTKKVIGRFTLYVGQRALVDGAKS